MSSEENAKPVNVDPRCIQEALRMYLQPIKNEDPQFDFYTTYKRETLEYDTEYMTKHNEDLNTTLIFAGLFSAVSSAFVIDVQSELEPDSGERSEAYLRAILLSLNRSVAPDEDPMAPPAWNGPPPEVVAASNLLYASLLMSLLAAFVAILGKQWLNRYLRHAGGSIVERCGDRQRKFDGLQKWPFRFFIESLPIMLQIALLLLTCGLSRYMWSVNTSVTRVIISFAVLGIIFYIGIVVAGMSSYECPFQTPTSTALRHLKDSGTFRKLLAGLSPPKVISFICAAWKNIQQRLVSAFHHVYETLQRALSGETPPSHIPPNTQHTRRNFRHQAATLLRQIGRAIGNANQRLVQRIGRFRRAGPLQIIAEDVHRQSLVLRSDPGLLVHVQNLEALRKQNADNARCVCWVLQNITDPEAIDSAIRLAGTIRWFDSDSDYDPLFDSIISTLKACFKSTGGLYPGMRDRAYFAGRAILQINAGARAQSHERASKYPIPEVSRRTFYTLDPDLHSVIDMLTHNFRTHRPYLRFPKGGTLTHSLWMSNLFVDATRVSPNPILETYQTYLNAAVTDNSAIIANTLLMWYMFLGGHVEEETFWAAEKSGSLETIISHLSIRMIKVIADGHDITPIIPLLEFLAAWKERPWCLIQMAHEWCSAISEASGRHWSSELPIIQGAQRRYPPQDSLPGGYLENQLRDLAEACFHGAGPCCDLIRSHHTIYHTRRSPRPPTPHGYAILIPAILEIGFRNTRLGLERPNIRLNHTSHHERIFEIVFSSDDDELIADAMCVWVVDGNNAPPGLCACYFTKRMERDAPLSQRLRRVGIYAIERTWRHDLAILGLEILPLLNRLNIGVDDVHDKTEWVQLLMDVIRLPTGVEALASHYWGLLAETVVAARRFVDFESRDVEVMRLLKETRDWNKLVVWMAAVWCGTDNWPPTAMQEIEQMTLELLLQQPLLSQLFKDLCASGRLDPALEDPLRSICEQVPAVQPPSESPPPQSARAQSLFPLHLAGDDSF